MAIYVDIWLSVVVPYPENSLFVEVIVGENSRFTAGLFMYELNRPYCNCRQKIAKETR